MSQYTKIVFENGVKRIGQNTFRYFKNVTKLEFPRSLESIGPYAFLECKLINVTMHNNVAVIGKGAFFKQNGNTASTISHIYYDGSEYEWNNIVIAQDNEPLTGAAIHYNSVGPATPTHPTFYSTFQIPYSTFHILLIPCFLFGILIS